MQSARTILFAPPHFPNPRAARFLQTKGMRTLIAIFLISLSSQASAKTPGAGLALIPSTQIAADFPWPWTWNLPWTAEKPGRSSWRGRKATRRTKRYTRRSAFLTRLSLSNKKRKAGRAARRGVEGKPKRHKVR